MTMPREITPRNTGGSRAGAAKGGRARMGRLTPEERSENARKAAAARWVKNEDESLESAVLAGEVLPAEDDSSLPDAKHRGVLRLLNIELPCYVLSDGRRVVGRTSATEMLT